MNSGSRWDAGKWILGILLGSAALALLQPAVVPLRGGTSMDRALSVNYGIPPLRWIQVQVPPSQAIPGTGAQYLKLPAIGLDYICVDTYLRCAGPGRDIYSAVCPGDPLKRPFQYPPLMAYMFAWVPLLPVLNAIGIWSSFILICIFAATWILAFLVQRMGGSNVPCSPIITALLLTSAYPSVFAFDRGNNDVWILLCYSAAAAALLSGRNLWVGLMVAVSVMLKLYPAPLAVACAFIALTTLMRNRARALSLLLGLIGGIAVVLVPLFDAYRFFVFEHYPKTTSYDIIPGSALDHSLVVSYGHVGMAIGLLLWIAAVVVWTRSELGLDPSKSRQSRILLSFCYLAALCTYLFPRTESFDYNLITAFPLLICLAYTAVRPGAAGWWFKFGTVLWTAGIALPRWINASVFGFPERSFSVFLVMQAAGLICLAAYLLFESFGCDIVENHDNSR